MSVLNQIAYFQDRRDETPNQELARDLVTKQDRAGIQEIAENLWNPNPNVQADCLKVLYEIGYLAPDLVADRSADFLKLLRHRNNRMVWGAMIALSTVAALKGDEIYPRRDEITRAMAQGSVITVDNGVKVLATLAASSDERRQTLLPYLLHHLETCRPKDVPQHCEQIIIAVDAESKGLFSAILEKRLAQMSPSQAARVKRVLKTASTR